MQYERRQFVSFEVPSHLLGRLATAVAELPGTNRASTIDDYLLQTDRNSTPAKVAKPLNRIYRIRHQGKHVWADERKLKFRSTASTTKLSRIKLHELPSWQSGSSFPAMPRPETLWPRFNKSTNSDGHHRWLGIRFDRVEANWGLESLGMEVAPVRVTLDAAFRRLHTSQNGYACTNDRPGILTIKFDRALPTRLRRLVYDFRLNASCITVHQVAHSQADLEEDALTGPQIFVPASSANREVQCA